MITFFDDKFLVSVLFDLKTHSFINSVDGVAELLVKSLSSDVGTDGDVGMASPGIEGLLVQSSSQLNPFASGNVVLQRVERLSSVSRRDQMDDPIVSLISERGPGPPLLVHDRLELLLGDVGLRVGRASVTQNDAG